jgi:hypothetical protein
MWNLGKKLNKITPGGDDRTYNLFGVFGLFWSTPNGGLFWEFFLKKKLL